MKTFAISILLAASFATPAAAATISFTANTTTLPSYTTATVIQSFQQSGSGFPSLPNFTPNATNTLGVETLSGGGTARITTSDPNMVGRFLTIGNGKTYTLDFGTSAVQFLAFLVDNYRATNRVRLTYSNGTTASNVLNGLSGLNIGSSGLVVFDQQGGLGISKIEFQALANQNNNENNNNNQSAFSIDQIATAAPEPATWGMMLIGFGVVGGQLRRRRKLSLAAA